VNVRALRKTIVVLLTAGLVCGVSPHLKADKSTTIVFLMWKPNQPEVWEHLIQRFHREHPGIRVQVQVGPHSSTEYHAIVTQRLKNRDASVDVFFMDVIWPPEFASAGWAIDLTSRLSKEEQGEFLTATIAANTYGNRLYGVPCFLDAGLLYYRKDLLEKYGLKPPRSWTEMLAQGDLITKGEADRTLHVYSAQFKQYEGLVCNMLEFIWSHGCSVLDADRRRVRLAEPASIHAIAFVRDKIIGKAAPKGVVNYEEPESLDLFIQGGAVFHRNWPYAWAVSNDPDKSNVPGRVGVAPLPAFAGHSSASALGGWQLGISQWSKQPDEAWEFVEFMTSVDSQKTLAIEAGLAPSRIRIYRDPEIQKKMPHLRAFLPAFERARHRPVSPVYSMISQELQRFFSQAIVERTSNLSGLADGTSARIEKLVQLGAMIRP
jgi:multiple sugar transport system substrate-binding protein